MIRTFRTLLCALMLAAPVAAFAQTAQQGSVQPSENRKVGDWTVRCYPITSPSPCDMYLVVSQNNQRALGVSIAYVPFRNQHAIQLTLPLGISIPKGVTLTSGSYSTPTWKYRRCNATGCYVELLIDNGIVSSIGRGGNTAKVTVYSDNGQKVDLPFSLKGYSDAHDQMANLARQNAKAPTPAATPASGSIDATPKP